MDSLREPLKLLFVNCWYMGDVESAAMWSGYGGSTGAICIMSSVARLKSALEPAQETVFLGEIEYVNYEREAFVPENLMTPALHKRASFAHEKELRAITISSRHRGRPGQGLYRLGFGVDVQLADLVDRVLVAPREPDWIVETIRGVCDRFALDVPVMPSTLLDPPPWHAPPAGGEEE